jgi:hypothetical protein
MPVISQIALIHRHQREAEAEHQRGDHEELHQHRTVERPIDGAFPASTYDYFLATASVAASVSGQPPLLDHDTHKENGGDDEQDEASRRLPADLLGRSSFLWIPVHLELR